MNFEHCLTGNHSFLFLTTFFLIKTKKRYVFPKNGQNKICRSVWDEQFYILTFFRISHSLAGKGIFWFCEKPFLMDKTRTVGQKWLANELDLHFLTLTKCTNLWKVIVYTDRQTDRHFCETLIFGFRGSQNVKICWKRRGSNFTKIYYLLWWECKNKIFDVSIK